MKKNNNKPRLRPWRSPKRFSLLLWQAEAFKKDAARLTADNNRQHQQQLQAADASDAQAREHYKQVKAQESEIAELRFWKQNILKRFLALESENEGLKDRLRDADAHAGTDADNAVALGCASKRGDVTVPSSCCNALKASRQSYAGSDNALYTWQTVLPERHRSDAHTSDKLLLHKRHRSITHISGSSHRPR